MRRLLTLLTSVLMSLASPASALQFGSTFDAGNDGWRYGAPAPHIPQQGPGYVFGPDPDTGETYWFAPSWLLCDLSVSYGLNLSFTLADEPGGGASFDPTNYPFVTLSSSMGTLTCFQSPVAVPRLPGVTFSIPLAPGSGWRFGSEPASPLATEQQIRDVLSTLSGMALRAEWWNGPETMMLFDVGFDLGPDPLLGERVSRFPPPHNEGWLVHSCQTTSVAPAFGSEASPHEGFIFLADQDSCQALWRAPRKFLGNISNIPGGLSFDLRDAHGGSTSFDGNGIPLVSIHSGCQRLVYFPNMLPPELGVWRHFNVPLMSEAGWHLGQSIADPIPTQAEFEAIARFTTKLEIRAEFYSGLADTVALDNVLMGQDDVSGLPPDLETPVWLTVESNPSRGSVGVMFSVRNSGPATIEVFDLAGRRLSAWLNVRGSGRRVWSGSDEAGRPAPAGVYFIRLSAGDHTETLRVLLLH